MNRLKTKLPLKKLGDKGKNQMLLGPINKGHMDLRQNKLLIKQNKNDIKSKKNKWLK